MLKQQKMIVIDWGTTNFRAQHIDSTGEVIASEQRDCGVASLSKPQMADVIKQVYNNSPLKEPTLYTCGMIGSSIGWYDVPYIPCRASLSSLAKGVHWSDFDGVPVGILPGLKCQATNGSWDVMRGEEMQALGWASTQAEPNTLNSVCITPGTHSKWIKIEQGEISTFFTNMTGEIFALLKTHGLLRHHITESVTASPEFLLGLEQGGSEQCLGRLLFSIRANCLLAGMTPQQASDFASGLLIGAEITDGLREYAIKPQHSPLCIIGSPALTNLYHAALTYKQISAIQVNSQDANLAGFKAVHKAGGRLHAA
jgi:2-dehydro-3-deoxygalactonokinase